MCFFLWHTLVLLNRVGIVKLDGGAITRIEDIFLLEKHKPKMQWKRNSCELFFFFFSLCVDEDYGVLPITNANFYASRRSLSIGSSRCLVNLGNWAMIGLFFFFFFYIHCCARLGSFTNKLCC